MNKTIHIIGAGGPAGIGLTRCLKDHYEVTGSDDSLWGSLMKEASSRTSSSFIDMHISVPDNRITLNDFLPDSVFRYICEDKERTAKVIGDLAPRTYWLRETTGSGGRGAQMLTGYLPGDNYSQEFVFHEGKVLAAFQKKRLSYKVSHRTEGIENIGSSAVSICTNREDVKDVALEALRTIELTEFRGVKLTGFFGVDLKCDESGVPKVTEINAGRLLTASYSYYYLTGYNLPLIGVQCFLGEELSPLPDYPEGWGLIRQIDQLPKLFPPEVTKDWV